jgi:hypothetical protein
MCGLSTNRLSYWCTQPERLLRLISGADSVHRYSQSVDMVNTDKVSDVQGVSIFMIEFTG